MLYYSQNRTLTRVHCLHWKGYGMKAQYTEKDEAILKAYEQLIIQKRDTALISVSDIIKEAGVSRSTFYAHFESKEELTDIMARRLAEDFYTIVKDGHAATTGKESYYHIYENHLQYIKDHQALGLVVLTNDASTPIINTILAAIRDDLTDYYKVSHRNFTEESLNNTATFWTYGVYGLLRDWVSDGCNTSAADMSRSIVGAISNCASFYNKEY